MAVYTSIELKDISAWVETYGIGTPLVLKGIESGVENSNFLLTTTEGRYILTLYEKRVSKEDLPFFLSLLQHLAAKSIPCPEPVAGEDGVVLHELKERPAAIVSFLEGASPQFVRNHHAREVGRQLAHMHKAAADFSGKRGNNFSLSSWVELFDKVKERGDTVKQGLVAEIGAYLQELQQRWPSSLPSGVIHADLFPDNVFFQGKTLSGVIDFYFACNDFLMYDLAICLNAWCFEPTGEFNITKARHMLAGYDAVRPISKEELDALPVLAQGAAMRFLLTRLYDWLHVVEGALVQRKDPLEYLRKLRFHHGVNHPSAYGL